MKTKQNVAATLSLILYLLPSAGFAASQNGYRVTAPPAFPIFNTDQPEPWAETNGTSVVWISGGSGFDIDQQGNGTYPEATAHPPKMDAYRLVESAIGASIEHIKPDYYLGDLITPPMTDVDWEATYARLVNSSAYSNNAVFYEPSVPGIFLSSGGLIQIEWVQQGGSIKTNFYQVSGSSRQKPYRIYWTDEPYNAPPVDLTGKFVKFYGNTNIIHVQYGAVFSDAGGRPSTGTNVVSGLFLDSATHWLQAIGGIQGMVVMAYYRTGSYSEMLGSIVVEVCAPDTKTVRGEIGAQLKPTGDGYDVVGLNALVTEGLSSDDNVGPYVFQYKGPHSYSPKNKNLYAIRKTVGESWKIEVYWQQNDLMGTSWPFEILHYECDWPANSERFVVGKEPSDGVINYGLTVPIPTTYAAELMEFQEPAGHASVVNNVLSAKNSGNSLLQLTGTDVNGDDNIWFIPIHTIWRDDPRFDLTPGAWPVGLEVTPLPTSIALAFDGASASLETQITNQLSGSFTIECFFQADKTERMQTLFFKNAISTNVDFQVVIGADGVVSATMGTDAANESACSVVAQNKIRFGDQTWHHLALIYDQVATNVSLVLDGVQSTRQTTPPRVTSHAGALTFGMDSAAEPLGYFKGKMDDIRIWSRALSMNDIQSGMAGFLHGATNAANLIAYYPINNGIGRKAIDASSNQNDATMVNCIRVAPGAIGLSNMDGFSKYHGYIYEAVSGDNYNTNLYIRPDQLSTDDDPSAPAGSDETYIFAVNKTTDKPMEIWWSHEVSQEAMPETLWFPAWVQQYAFHWPHNKFEVPEIVLASQKGSANESLVKRGVAVDFSRSVDSRMKIADGAWFAGDNYTVECWVKPHNMNQDLQVFNFNNGDSRNSVALTILAGGRIKYSVSKTSEAQLEFQPNATNTLRQGWNHLALVMSSTHATICLDGREVYASGITNLPSWTVATTNNYLASGVQAGQHLSFDGQIDEFRIWNVARSTNEVHDNMLTKLTGQELGLQLYYPFDDDLNQYTTEARYAYDRVHNLQALITYSDWAIPGAPRLDTGVLIADEAPFVYYQNDRTKPGYNPNEEHAFVEASEGGYVTYALRCDLNDSESDPYVLVQYNDPENNGRPMMQVYHVAATNQLYTDFAGTMTAGKMVPGPHPLDLLPDPWTTKTYWGSGTTENSTELPGYRDRKGQIWAKRAGVDGATDTLEMHNFYPMQEGFFFPPEIPLPSLGTPIPWLCRLNNPDADLLAGAPIPWIWTVNWPTNSPRIDIGQTLTTATKGLPEVWNAKSMMLIYEPKEGDMALYDPMVEQSASLDFEGDFATYFGFDSGPNGTIQLKNGKTYFMGVPPNVSSRFYFDPAAAKTNCLKLVGNRVNHPGGLSYLQLNVLSHEERKALIGLVKNKDKAAIWKKAIEKLAINCVDAAIPPNKGVYDSKAVVNYALTHMGPGAGGYVTLIENDARNPACNVNDGDPIQMHIIQLSSNLYAGAVLPLEDPNNLLSEQLDILYTESFAGDSGDYEFEWRRAEPNENGTTSTNYLHKYRLYRQEDGLTRFTVGKQGDTLPDMVNNFYVMRYRVADTDSELAAITGGAWSDWIGPTLAEGWVQRVLNNVTPFTQRMQDMYNNPAETTVSMIQQAGGPYEGDVALNQDNLNNIGLIQLYQTLLNKAESMSLAMGINDTAANQQLMLAATRLNDLYMLLGNEAYADAMDPTIGFGSDYFNSDDFSMGAIDYGSMSSSLFCFDNLMPNLRDEELALLRGRSDQLAPSLHLSPTYNRLYWNFTKGITAGEVAYAMNYQIFGSDVTIDQPQAATLYPQGHGDAWGHYLSALKGYYRLLRNPHFSWGTPSISPMMVGDAVIDADYYDEEKFAETAAAMARTGAEVVKRSCEKSYIDNGGTALAGYFDEDQNRAFGYGEWGVRAGLSSLYNWASANSLLPPGADPESYEFLTFATNTQLQCMAPSSEIDFSSDFTIEFKVKPDATLQSASGSSVLFDWRADEGTRSDAGAISIVLDLSKGVLALQGQGLGTNACMVRPPFDEWSHVAITYFKSMSRLTLYLNGVQQGDALTVYMPDTVTQLASPLISLAANDSPVPFSGALSEFRIWNVVRTPAELIAGRDGVSATSDGLLMAQRFMVDPVQGGSLPDEACGAIWSVSNPVWQKQSVAGVTLTFADDSILRINRDSVGSLAEICAAMKDVQRSVDQADAGMTPLGLSGAAIPFDIDPVELANGKSHFEQILARAEQALGNAATLLDRAQGVSKLQRQQTQNASNMQTDLVNEEVAFNIQLIGIFGYPYAADIGVGGTYPQGYDGPDLYHYMWMDLKSYGFTDFDLKPQTNVTYKVKVAAVKDSDEETRELSFDIAANGMILKPSKIGGSRRAQGRLQASYGAFIQAYLEYRKALLDFDEKVNFMNSQSDWLLSKIVIIDSLEALSDIHLVKNIVELKKQLTILSKISIEAIGYDAQTRSLESTMVGIPSVLGVGLTEITDIGAPLKGIMQDAAFPEKVISYRAQINGKLADQKSKRRWKFFNETVEIINDVAKLLFESQKDLAELQKNVMEANEAGLALDIAYAAMINAQESYLSVLAEGEMVLSKREQLRKQAANRIAAGRYQDMAFRTFRNDALAKYGNAFDLAKKYTYLATKAYDYETALGLGDAYQSDSIFREIVGARTIGFVEDGEAQLGGLHGDGGLADVLARLKANWLVLKGRLGINNAQSETCWVSLRSELFRIKPDGTAADTAWQNTLSAHRVNNLLDHPEFRRYCLPFESSTGLLGMEPGLVIPFSTSIDFAQNLFGWPLAGNDHTFDSSHYATKINKLGIKFIGYNNVTNSVVALSNAPRVYLIPVGSDIMRSPGANGGQLLAYNVVDQVVPLPFPLGNSTLDEPDWTAIYDAYTGNDDPLATIRRYPSLRAYHDRGTTTDDMISSSRLVGRSVWNTRWLLIIPAGTFHADRDFALDALIKGVDLDKDGKLDQPGIRDIQIGFETYSNAGN